MRARPAVPAHPSRNKDDNSGGWVRRCQQHIIGEFWRVSIQSDLIWLANDLYAEISLAPQGVRIGEVLMSDTSNSISDVLPDPLPMWQTVKQAYAAFFGNLATLLKIALPWLLIDRMLVIRLIRSAQVLGRKCGRALAAQTYLSCPQFGLGRRFRWRSISLSELQERRWLSLGTACCCSVNNPSSGAVFLALTVWRYIGAGIAMSIVSMLPALLVSCRHCCFSGQ